jgi:hypothetical protein
MTLYYRLMGLVAAACSRGSRFRINGIGAHYFFIGAAAVIGIIFALDSNDHSRNFGKPPVPYTVATSAQASAGDYVSITGTVASDIHISSSGSSDDNYSVLYDPKTKAALLITNAPAARTGQVTVTGLLYQVPTDLSSHLADIAGYNVTDAWVLRNGTTPNDPRTGNIVLGIVGVFLAILIASSLQKHIIFEKVPQPYRLGEAAVDTGEATNIDMRYSGRLLLPGKAVNRFLSVPVSLVVTPTGKLAFASRINASVSQQVGPMIDRDGVWSSVVEPGTLRGIDSGRQYVGTSIRPALRIRYEDANFKKKRETMTVLSFASEAERDAARRMIEQSPQEVAAIVQRPAPAAAPAFPAPSAQPKPMVDPSPAAIAQPTAAAAIVEPIMSAPDMSPFVPYKHSGKCPPAGVLLLLAGALVVGAVTGTVYHFLAKFMDIPIVSPILAGLVAGGITGTLVKAARCRNPRVLLVIGVLAGLFAYGARLVADSQEIRPMIVRAFTRHYVQAGLPPAQAVARAEARLDPVTTLRVYLVVGSQVGVVLTDTHSSSYNISTSGGAQNVGGTVVSGIWYWLLLLAELICCAIAAGALAQLSLNQSAYCEQSGVWMTSTVLAKLAPRQTDQTTALVNARDWNALRRLKPQGAMNDQNFVRVTLRRCPVCESGTLMVDTQAGNQVKRLLHVHIDPSTVATLSTAPLPVSTATL